MARIARMCLNLRPYEPSCRSGAGPLLVLARKLLLPSDGKRERPKGSATSVHSKLHQHHQLRSPTHDRHEPHHSFGNGSRSGPHNPMDLHFEPCRPADDGQANAANPRFQRADPGPKGNQKRPHPETGQTAPSVIAWAAAEDNPGHWRNAQTHARSETEPKPWAKPRSEAEPEQRMVAATDTTAELDGTT